MKVIGFNLAHTSYGLPLDNGGACLIVDGELKMLINEERLNRQQYSAGFQKSIQYLLQHNNLNLEDIDLFVASRCLDAKPSVVEVQKQLAEHGFAVSEDKIAVCGHHLSHAYSAYYPSGFEEALVMVIDGDGNLLTENMTSGTDNPHSYFQNQFEHNSYFIGKGDSLEFLERDEIQAGENGFGGVYRYFTYFCGFPGYKFAGKLMGLSAYGKKRNKYQDVKIFDLLPNGQVKCLIPDLDRSREHSAQIVEDWLAQQGVNVKALKPGAEISAEIEDVSYLIQRELDRALVYKVNYLVQKTGIKKLCIAGGVGLNAVSNRAILDHTAIEKLYVQPASGDSGQCLGNAYYGLAQDATASQKRRKISVYQGAEYSESDILSALQNSDDPIKYRKMDFDQLSALAAKQIMDNKIVGWFQGRSEMGPRALGNRSMLANPANKDMKDIINAKVKHREKFRPFAPSVLAEKASQWFDLDFAAPYMVINAQVKHPNQVASITHEDGSARLQTVSQTDNPRYYQLIQEFEKLSGVPILLNTSLNDNEAIVETPRDAINLFVRTGLDCLFLGDYYVEKQAELKSRQASLAKIENQWPQIAAHSSQSQSIKKQVLDQKILKILAKYLTPGAKIFDYNCDWGDCANLLAQNSYTVHAHSTSDQMIAEAKQKFQAPVFLNSQELYRDLHTLENRFDLVMSNLWLSIIQQSEHEQFLKNLKKLLKDDGLILLSFCHPCFDYMSESIVSHRVLPKGKIRYDQELKHTKIIHENGLEFTDYHRPLEYYTSLFRKNRLKIVNVFESEILNTNFYPDFVIFILKKDPHAKT